LIEDALPHDSGADLQGFRVWLVAMLLFVVALVPRTVNLGRLSFYADEDISVLTAAAVAAGDGSVLPSGMEYRRALPLTWLDAASVRLFGGPTELSVRLPAAILGALTVPMLFLMGIRWVGFGGGLTAALFLALSEWHLVFSRQARMYVVLLLFVVLATWALSAWARTGRRSALGAGLVSTAVALLLHKLAVFLAAAPLVWLAFPGALAVSIPAAIGVAALIAVTGWAVSDYWVSLPYRALSMPPPLAGARAAMETSAAPSSPGAVTIALAAVGLLLAAAILRRTPRPPDGERGARLRDVAWVGLALTAGAAAGAGQLYLFAVAGALFLLLDGRGVAPMLSRARLPLLGLLGILALQAVRHVPSAGLVGALKLSARFPYPHAYTLVLQAAAPTVLFGAASLRLILFPFDERRRGMAAASMLVFATLVALGIAREAGPTRYLITAYPLMMLVAGAGLYEGLKWVVDRVVARKEGWSAWSARVAGTLAGALVLGGAFSGHGVRAAIHLVRLGHGEPVNELTHMFPFRPDHRSAGRYVRAHRVDGDVVIAEDPIVQRWYAGKIDYWFRRYGDMRSYLRVQPDGSIRDIYAGSRPIGDPAAIDSIAAGARGRVWFITSGETAPLPSYYLSPDQADWLDSLRLTRTPVFVGEDGVSAVYCLNCDEGAGAEGLSGGSATG